VATFGNRFIRKCVAPIRILSVPKRVLDSLRGAGAIACGFSSSRLCTASKHALMFPPRDAALLGA